MKNQNFTTSILVEQTPKEVFKAINKVRDWWNGEIEGNTDHLHDVFNYHYGDMHRCKLKLIELIPNKKIVWLVEENYFKFTKDKTEWTGNKIVFEITEKENKTQLQFTQEGLVPSYECYEICKEAWNNYIQKSLRNLIVNGKGQASQY